MNKNQLLALFAINLAVNTVGNTMGALLPINAARLGASTDWIGLYMAGVFLGLASGSLVAGWLSDRLGRRKTLLVATGAIAVIGFWGIGRVANMTQLALVSVFTTFLEGMQIALISILTGLYAGSGQRGRIFGLLGSGSSLGALLSGLAGGVVTRWGFPGLFTATALVTLLQPLIGLRLADVVSEPEQPGVGRQPARSALTSRTFVFLFIASVLAFGMSGVFGLARSLWMDKAGYNATAIMSTVVISGLVTLPFPLVMGWLSDRVGRRPLLMVCYAAGALGLFGLAFSTQLWQFWVSAAIQTVLGASLGVGSALVTDLVPQEALGSGLSLFGATMWIGLIFGSLLAGLSIQRLDFTLTLILGACLALLTVIMVLPIRHPLPQSSARTGG